MDNVTLAILQVFFSLVIESTLLAGLFSYLTNKANEKQEENLKEEIKRVEMKNRFMYEQLQQEIRNTKTELISQIKESTQ